MFPIESLPSVVPMEILKSPRPDLQAALKRGRWQDEIWRVSLSWDVSWVFVRCRFLSTDHIKRWKSAYTSWWVAKAWWSWGPPQTRRSRDTGTSSLTMLSIFAILANARGTRSTWGRHKTCEMLFELKFISLYVFKMIGLYMKISWKAIYVKVIKSKSLVISSMCCI